MRRATLVLVIVAIATPAIGQIQKWKTGDGRIVYGNAPPAGAEVIDTYQADRRSDEAPELGSSAAPMQAADEDRFSVEASLERRRIEKDLRRLWDQHRATERQVAYWESLQITGRSDTLPSANFVAGAINLQSEKTQKLARLAEAKGRLEGQIRAKEAEMLALQDRVRDHYGELPAWWRSIAP